MSQCACAPYIYLALFTRGPLVWIVTLVLLELNPPRDTQELNGSSVTPPSPPPLVHASSWAGGGSEQGGFEEGWVGGWLVWSRWCGGP